MQKFLIKKQNNTYSITNVSCSIYCTVPRFFSSLTQVSLSQIIPKPSQLHLGNDPHWHTSEKHSLLMQSLLWATVITFWPVFVPSLLVYISSNVSFKNHLSCWFLFKISWDFLFPIEQNSKLLASKAFQSLRTIFPATSCHFSSCILYSDHSLSWKNKSYQCNSLSYLTCHICPPIYRKFLTCTYCLCYSLWWWSVIEFLIFFPKFLHIYLMMDDNIKFAF